MTAMTEPRMAAGTMYFGQRSMHVSVAAQPWAARARKFVSLRKHCHYESDPPPASDSR